MIPGIIQSPYAEAIKGNASNAIKRRSLEKPIGPPNEKKRKRADSNIAEGGGEPQATRNAIGSLQEFCSSRLMQVPSYEVVRDEGLPHCKIFCIRCQVSSFYTEGQAKTKKQAKQLSAQFMLEKLKGDLGNWVAEYTPPPIVELKIPDIIRRVELLRRPSSKGLQINELHFSIKELVKYKPSPTLEEIQVSKLTDFNGLNKPEETLKLILNELQFQLNEKILTAKDNDVAVVAVELKGPAKWTFIGCSPSKTAAFIQARISALKFLAEMTI